MTKVRCSRCKRLIKGGTCDAVGCAGIAERYELHVPTVHLNGTSKERLLEDLCEATHALHEAGKALAITCPNGRDYYPQGQFVIGEAITQHEDRLRRLRDITTELEAIAEAIA